MSKTTRERLDADPNNVITCCPKCEKRGEKLQVLYVSDKSNHVYCGACGDYPTPEIWESILARHCKV